jgi:MoaA/NifB/PqqE/SkfB family radical SAM enzyme
MLAVRIEHFGGLVYNSRTARYFHIGSSDTERLRSCAPSGTIDDLLKALEWSIADKGCPVIRWIENARCLPTVLSAPMKAFFNITKRCNLYCSHCYNSSGEQHSPELDFDTIVTVLEELEQRGIFKVTLAGGEPLFHPSIDAILDFLNGKALDVSIVTNGIPVSEERVQAFAACSALRSITVSIDGANAEDNDLVRGKNAFARATLGLKLIRRVFPRAVAVRVTLTRCNIERICELPQLLSEWGVSALKVNRVNPYGRAVDNPGVLLTEEEYKDARGRLQVRCEEENISLEVPSFKYQQTLSGQVGLCRAGEESMEIDGDGNVYPCSFSFGRFLAGNVRSCTFVDILSALQQHSINNEWCLSCRGRGGNGEKTIGYVPKLVQLV